MNIGLAILVAFSMWQGEQIQNAQPVIKMCSGITGECEVSPKQGEQGRPAVMCGIQNSPCEISQGEQVVITTSATAGPMTWKVNAQPMLTVEKAVYEDGPEATCDWPHLPKGTKCYHPGRFTCSNPSATLLESVDGKQHWCLIVSSGKE